MTEYILDSNVFIEAKNSYYDFNICPAFWNWIMVKYAEGIVSSIDEVGIELRHYGDRLEEWVEKLQDSFFKKPDGIVLSCKTQLAIWLEKQDKYDTRARHNFLKGADSWLIAHAMAYKSVVVTMEKSRNSYKKFTIPDVCAKFGVDCIDTFKMLKLEKARFILESKN